jgi:hypothetical protein
MDKWTRRWPAKTPRVAHVNHIVAIAMFMYVSAWSVTLCK